METFQLHNNMPAGSNPFTSQQRSPSGDLAEKRVAYSLPDTLPVVFATCAGTSSTLAALTFTKAAISSGKAKNPDAKACFFKY